MVCLNVRINVTQKMELQKNAWKWRDECAKIKSNTEYLARDNVLCRRGERRGGGRGVIIDYCTWRAKVHSRGGYRDLYFGYLLLKHKTSRNSNNSNNCTRERLAAGGHPRVQKIPQERNFKT